MIPFLIESPRTFKYNTLYNNNEQKLREREREGEKKQKKNNTLQIYIKYILTQMIKIKKYISQNILFKEKRKKKKKVGGKIYGIMNIAHHKEKRF